MVVTVSEIKTTAILFLLGKNNRAFESKFRCYENPNKLHNTTSIGTLFYKRSIPFDISGKGFFEDSNFSREGKMQ
jgi:hypothetical protein